MNLHSNNNEKPRTVTIKEADELAQKIIGDDFKELEYVSDCCKAHYTTKENLKWDNGRLVCVGTYHLCDKCGFICDSEYITHTPSPNVSETPEAKLNTLIYIYKNREPKTHAIEDITWLINRVRQLERELNLTKAEVEYWRKKV